MKNIWKWIAVTLAVVFVGSWMITPLLHSFGVSTSYMPMFSSFRGERAFGGGMMGGGMIAGGYILPLIVLGLAIWGGVSLIKGASKTQPASGPVSAPAELDCAQCGKDIQPDWVTCPYCGRKI